MALSTIELELHDQIIESLPAQKKFGYTPRTFLRMMADSTPANAIRYLLDKPSKSEGFDTLWENGRLDLSVEAISLEPKWASLFTFRQKQEAWRRLMSVGYTVAEPKEEEVAGSEWSEGECAATVRDYFSMLSEELIGTPYSKAGHNRQLQQVVPRSAGSIEFKHANISAILVEMQMPSIDGYKPRGNYQKLLADSVFAYLDKNPDFFTSSQVLAAIEPTAPQVIEVKTTAGIFQEVPEAILSSPQATPWLSRKGRRTNFTERDARNRALGKAGERFALDVERRALQEAGRDDLALKVEWIADTCGDGVGFDVLSFDAKTDAEKWVEVKTTVLGKYHPFMVTENEVRCSVAEPERFHLFRVYEFKESPRIYVLPGSLSERCKMRPSSYVAVPKLVVTGE